MVCNFGPDDIFYIALGVSIAATVSAAPSSFLLPRVASIKITIPVFIATLLFLMITILGGYMPYAMFHVLAVLFGIVNYLLLTQVIGMYNCMITLLKVSIL